MIDLDEKLRGTSARMLLQIHDSVLVEVAEADAQMINDLVKKTMEDTVKLSVKLTVDSVIAKNWGLL